VFGKLVDGRRRVQVAGGQRFGEWPVVELARQRVHVRVAEVERDGVAAVGLLDRGQPAGHLGEGVLPRRLDQLSSPAHQRPPQPIGVGFQLTDRRALRAEVAPAQDVGGIAFDTHDAVAVERELEAAGGLAQGAGAKRDGRHNGSPV
jgi:hypothetical protein